MYPQIPNKSYQQFILCKNLLQPVILDLDFSHNYLIGIDWFSSNQLHLHQGPKSIVTSDSAPFPLHVNQISTLPQPHILVKMVSQVTIPPRMISIIPTTFNGIPKPNCHYSLLGSLIQHELLWHLLVVPLLKTFGEKLPSQLLCMIINTSSDEIALPKVGEMKPISNIGNHLKPLVIREVTYAIDSDQVDTWCTQFKNYSYNQCEPTNDWKPVQKNLILMPCAIQIHRQVLLSNAKISKETKINYMKC